MKKFVIERNLPGAENLSPDELQALAKTFFDSESKVEEAYVWMHSYIAGDKIYCVALAENEEAIRLHARAGNIPVNTISEVKTVIDRTLVPAADE
jgi:hypothetical protein